MSHRKFIATRVLAVVAVLLTSTLLADSDEPNVERFKPQWKVGQSWVVETVTRQSQARRAVDAARTVRPVRWRFEVEGTELRQGRPCFLVSIRCLQKGRQPVTTIWVDTKSMTLLGVQTRLGTAGGWTTIGESYRSSSGQPFAAFGPHSVPPVELPVFLPGTKGQMTFRYETSTSGDGSKTLGDIGFGFTVKQSVETAEAKDFPARLPEHFAKDLKTRPTIQVRLRSAINQTRQFWQVGLPWPVFSDNGVVESSLVTTEAAPEDSPD